MSSKLINCPTCNNPISINAAACPSCGEPLGKERSNKEEIIKKLEEQKKKTKELFIGLMAVFVIIFVISLIVKSFISPDLEELKETNPEEYNRLMEEQEAKNQEEADRIAQEEAKKAEEKRKGFHCLSPWDGSHRIVEREVENQMRDPDSFEHIETLISPVNENGVHSLTMKYRARNGFGGMSIGMARAIIQNDDCSAVILSVE
ncbi:hypothetical protein [uncultured Sneathiella sp.]|uniref:hypothetical protein n=1 Tax=uncultured Sneathiella sp. TaxID=879315 RepID=UPI0030D8B1E2